ncbi:Magnetosome protein MamN [Gammaproteobacteria bacterium]
MAAAPLSLALFALVFFLVEAEKVDRNQAMLAGAALMLVLGGWFGFYAPRKALFAIYFDTLALIFGMSLVVNLLVRSGLFGVLAVRVATYSRGHAPLVLVLLVLMSYGFSLVVNNLAAMLMILPLTLALCHTVRLEPVPILIAELIASNLGGASTLIGDFPNMIIGAAGKLHFDDFIGGMMVPCLIMLAILLGFFRGRLVRSEDLGGSETVKPVSPVVDRHLFRMGLSVMGATLLALIFAQPLGLQPATIALVAGIIVLVGGRIPPEALFKAMSGGDILFYAALFVMVGGLQASGVLEGLHTLIVNLGGQSATRTVLVLMWVSALLTPFLNPGPTTALLVPVAELLNREFAGSPVWWALSLGVLAGTSATLSGATAGPVVASQMMHQLAEHRRQYPSGWVLDSGRYRQWGLPIAITFLAFSTLYIAMLSL